MDYNLSTPESDIDAPYEGPIYLDTSNPARPAVLSLAENEDPQFNGIKTALGEKLVPVRLERTRVVNKAGNRIVANVLVFEKRSELKSLGKADLNSPKQVEQILDLGFQVNQYFLGSTGKPEALDLRGFYLKGGSQVVYLPGPPRKGNWSDGIEPYLGPAARNWAEGRLSEDELADNFGRVMFKFVHGVAPGLDRRAVDQVADRRLARAWKQVFRPGTKLQEVRDTLRPLLTTTPLPDVKLRLERTVGKSSRWWVLALLLVLLCGGSAAAYLKAKDFALSWIDKDGAKKPVAPITPVVADPISPKPTEPEPPKTDQGKPDAKTAGPSNKAPVQPPDKAKPVQLIPSQTLVFYQPDSQVKEPQGTPPGQSKPPADSPSKAGMVKLGPPDQSVSLKIPAGYKVWKPEEPTKEAMRLRIQEFSEAQAVQMVDGVWIIKDARRYVHEIMDAIQHCGFKATDATTGKPYILEFHEYREATTGMMTFIFRDVDVGNDPTVRLKLFGKDARIPNAQPLWSKIELNAVDDPDVDEKVLKSMSGILDLTKAGSALDLPTIVGHPYTLVAHRVDGGRDVFQKIVMVHQKRKHIEEDIRSVFKRAKMPVPEDLGRYIVDRGNSTFVPRLAELLTAIRDHFNSSPDVDAPQETDNPVYRFEKKS